jgi:mono/diheme cytochrome c family protein
VYEPSAPSQTWRPAISSALGVALLILAVPVKASDTDWASLRTLYDNNCADCHGADGSAREMRTDFPSIPDFRAIKWQQSRSSSELRASIKMGMGDEMPAFEGELSAEEIRQLTAFIRTLAPEFTEKGQPGPPHADNFANRMAKLGEEWDQLRQQFELARHGK